MNSSTDTSGQSQTTPVANGSTARGEVLFEVRVPRETVNDDTVTIADWHAAHAKAVRNKELVVSIETSKAVLEVESEVEGYLEILYPKGAEVGIGELIGRVLSSPPAARAASAPATPAIGAPSSAAGSPAQPMVSPGAQAQPARVAEKTAPGTPSASFPQAAAPGAIFSKKAQALIDEHRLDSARFASLGMVREADVIRHLESTRQAGVTRDNEPIPAPDSRDEFAPREAATAHARGTDGAYQAPQGGGLLGDAAVSAGERGKSLPWLVLNYLIRNWLLGNLVRWAPRGVILHLHKLRGVNMGRDVFIDPTALVETAYPNLITIGNDVRITAGSVIMCHIKAPHYLRQTGIMPAVLKPVVLEDHCFIGVNAVVMPGVTVGKAAVVTSGSVVVSNVPAYSMVAGNPAKVIKRFPLPQ